MANLVLTTSNHASFFSSTWSGWATAPHDLLLVTEDGTVGAHCAMLLPLSSYLSRILNGLSFTEPIQVVLVGSSMKVAAAVKELVYTGTCSLERPALPEILETLAALGIKAFKKNFTLERKTESNAVGPSSTPFETQEADISSGTVDCELSKCGGAAEEHKAETLKTSCGNGAFQGKTVSKVYQNTVSHPTRNHEEKVQREGINMEKALQVRIPKLNTNELSLKEEAFTCKHPGCKLGFALKDSLKLHIKNLHPEKRPFFCNCKGRKSTFKSRRGLARHVNNAHPGEKLVKPYPCLQPDCAVRFRDNRSLHDHLRKAHGAEKLTCGYGNCKKAFNSSRRLNDHKKKHHHNQ